MNNPTPESAANAASPTVSALRIGTLAGLTAVGVTICLIVMLARVAQLQLAPGQNLAGFVSNRVTTTPAQAPRGDIHDARGRVLAATRFGYRVFIDPSEFPQPPGEAIAKLAGVIGLRPDEIAQRLVPRMVENERRKGLMADSDPANDRKPIRYVSIGGVLEDGKDELVRNLGIPGVGLERRSVREVPGGDLVAGLLGRVGIDHNGLLGAELYLDKQVTGTPGKLSYVRDARGKALWVSRGSFQAPVRGADARLSIDLEVQRIVHEELLRGVEEADAAGGRCVVLDPLTGEVLAMCDVLREVAAVDYPWTYPIGQEPGGRRPRYKTICDDGGRSREGLRNRCVEDAYEPGSTFKPFMWAETTALGLARSDEVFDTENGRWRTPYGRLISDVEEFPYQTWAHVLVHSSNIGMIKATARMSFKQMHDAVRKFGFGSRTRIGLPGESTGLVTSLKNWSKYSQTSVAMGHEIAVTPIQMVRAFSVFARPGELAGTLPPIRLVAAGGDAAMIPGERVLPASVAIEARNIMVGVTDRLDARLTRKAENPPLRYDAFGKSGTAEIPLGPPPPGKKRPKGSDGYFQGQYNASFIAGAPVREPRIVLVVVIDDPGPQRVATRTHYGAAAAGPVARRIIERTLSYLGVPPTNPDSGDKPRSVAVARP
jgi:cell division protein FtsI/penicillin-binding protein 2